ncbi:MAG: hypothetical protein ABII89_06640 [Candidatus Omnitrophota bacterium]
MGRIKTFQNRQKGGFVDIIVLLTNKFMALRLKKLKLFKAMDEIKDPELIGRTVLGDSISSDYDPFTNGLYIVGLTREQLESFGLFLNELYQKLREKEPRRQVTRNALTMLRGAIFALGTQKLKNPEWKEHCATSLREIFHEWEQGRVESDFCLFYKNSGEKLTEKESDTFRGFRLHYEYFTGIDHHNASTILGSLITLLKDNTLKLEDCYKDEVFIERVKDFFSKLTDIISFSRKK